MAQTKEQIAAIEAGREIAQININRLEKAAIRQRAVLDATESQLEFFNTMLS